MKTTINIILVCALALLTMQCEVVSDDLLQNPNAPSPDNVSPDFLLNNIQLSTAGLFSNMENEGGEVIRMYHMFGVSYPNAYQAQFFDSEWSTAYASILVDAKNLIPLANEREFFSHAGIARVLKAYTLIALVDKFGDVPLSEALDEANFNPNVDTGQEVYNVAFAELDSAIIDLNKDELVGPGNDLYYGGDDDAWVTLANTLKLKILYQQRLVSDDSDDAVAINSLLNGDVIDEPGEEFVFRFSTNPNNPDSRHPEFTGNYLSGAGDYMNNYYMNEFLAINNEKNVDDPRLRYYFYRQVSEPTDDPNEQDCINQAVPTHYSGVSGSGQDGNDPHCEDWNDVGYWGRDHGNSGGIPPDNFLRTTYGVYPAGGRFDADQAEGVAQDQGLQGAGIHPMWMPFYTDFVRAEVELTINGDVSPDGPAAIALENGIRNSIDYVINFSSAAVAATDTSGIANPANFVDSYVGDVLTRYAASMGTQSKLNLIAKEFYLALWGNGMEAYNLYRRVAPEKDAPNWDLQPHVESAAPGEFYRSFTYPSAFVERNSSVSQKTGNGVKVFWDNNRDGFANF